MAKEEAIRLEAKVVEKLPNARFRCIVASGDMEHEVLAHIAGKMRQHYIRIYVGDTVTLEMSPYDLTRGRIIYREA